jgi:integrase
MRKTLSDKGVAALKPRAKLYLYSDPELAGHHVRVMPSGTKSYVTVTRDPAGKQVWTTIGRADLLTVDAAREKARQILQRVRAGLPAVAEPAARFGEVVASWRQRHVEANGLRSAREINRLLNLHVLPAWKAREFTAIRRTDVAALLDQVEDRNGARQADYVLNITRSLMNWYATRHDDYVPPIVRGMQRQKTAARARVLDDDELRAIWQAAEKKAGPFAGILRLCLLTAQRSRKVAAMTWSDLDLATGTWTVPREPREKDTGGALALPAMALAIIDKQPRFASSPYVFPARGVGPFRGFSSSKAAFDKKLPKETRGWTVHDLRRTARSLLPRAGVLSEHAERVLGHAIRGVEGIYDRHQYFEEKRDALRRLAALVELIVHPAPATGTVVPMHRPRKGRR